MAINASVFSRINLTSLPEPSVVATPLFIEIKREIVAAFLELVPGYKLLLESDPVAKVIEVWAYREMILRARINETAKANLLAKASSGDLDQLGAFYNVQRMLIQSANSTVYPPVSAVYEDDEAFRYRIQTRIMGWANAGGVDHYRYWALSADSDVADAAVYSPTHPNGYNMGGRVIVTVLSKSGTGVPSDTVLTNVRNVVTGPSVKVVSDIVTVEPAVLRPLNIIATIRLLPRVPLQVFNDLSAKLRTEFEAHQSLGWDVTRSWLVHQLQSSGVHSVELISPSVDFIIPANEFPSIGTLSLTFIGYSDQEANDIDALEQARLRRLMYETYIQYAIANERPADGIANDLVFVEVPGVMQPTVVGLAGHLGIDNFYAADRQTLLTELEISTLIWNLLSPRYVSNL